MRRPPVEPDAGSATVWAAGAVIALLGLAGVLWLLGGAVVTRHRAASAADLAALAAAGNADHGTAAACARADEVVERMGARLRECRFERWDALVIVEAAGPGLLARFGPAIARARAGPVESEPASRGRSTERAR
ncbi:Rv3654c family TadE-like protein [Saccharomonospora sp. NPDC046836]|uniref:Rv3654c family TadE-like protein n=1 Tax=Saccharomonospora sp. NPDC046836 TaxID=3156921 RepID=UPI0033F264E5